MSRGGFRARYRGYGLWMNGGFVCVCISFFFCLVNFLGLSVCGIKNWWNEIGQSEGRLEFFFFLIQILIFVYRNFWLTN